MHRGLRRLEQFAHQRVALRVGLRVAALLDLGQAVVQRLDQQAAALGLSSRSSCR